MSDTGTTIYKYKQKNGSIRNIKTTKPIKTKETIITVWDDENEGYLSMIKDRILETITSYKYRKWNNKSIRTVETDRDVYKGGNYIKIWDMDKKFWRTMLQEGILIDIDEHLENMPVFSSSYDSS